MKPAILMVDVDGVVVRPANPSGWSTNIERDLGIPAVLLQSRFFQLHWDDVVHGRAGLRERLEVVLADIAPQVSCEQFIRYWFEGDAELDTRLLTRLAAVRTTGVALHLATVQEHERAAYLWNDLGLRDHFDAMHYAANLGASKPSQAFYEAVEQRVGLRGSAIAFIDDSEKTCKPRGKGAGKPRYGRQALRLTSFSQEARIAIAGSASPLAEVWRVRWLRTERLVSPEPPADRSCKFLR